MARHWSVFCGGVSEKQGIALDRMARTHDLGDGMDILMQLTGYSRSKVGKMDRASLRPYLDEAFERYSAAPAEARPDALTVAVESGLARINGEAAAEPTWAPPLRAVGVMVGLLRAHADRLERGEAFGPDDLRRLADKLNAEYLALHEQLHGGPS